MNKTSMPTTVLTTSVRLALSLLCCTALMCSAFAQSPKIIKADPGNNDGPPPGAILDLNGQPIPGGGNETYQQYTVNFQATLANTAITFAFRDDPAFLSLGSASVIDLTNPNGNLLVNGDFSGGTYSTAANGFVPDGWIYANIYGATFGGLPESGSAYCYALPYCWYDGAVQAYDAISQSITTNVGDNYQISFQLAESSFCQTDGGGSACNFSALSTNGDTTDTGGNGIDVTVYAQSSLPPPTQQLNLTLLDSGSGSVSDNQEMISCSETSGTISGTCSASYQLGTMVTLTATAVAPSTFGGWGGACASFGTSVSCTVTMNSTQNVTAAFIVPGQTQTQTVTLTAPAVYPFENNAYSYSAQLDSGTPTSATVTAILMPPSNCDELVQQTYPGAHCFVYGGLAPNPDSAILFELTCPALSNDKCNPFDAGLQTNFTLSTESGVNLLNLTDPFPGFLKGDGGVVAHPCTPPASGPLFQSNQIDLFTLSTIDPVTHARSGGGGSCWVATYSQPDEVPSAITITSPTGATYAQGAIVPATYTCSNPTSSHLPESTNNVGPYLTAASCTQSSGMQTSCTQTPTGLSCTGTVNTLTPGTNTFQVTAMDSGTNTSTQTVTYTVVAPTNLQILNVGLPGTAPTGSGITYAIGVADFGPANADGVTVTDVLPSNTSFVSATGSNISCSFVRGRLSCTSTPVQCFDSGGTVSCSVGNLAPLSLSSLNGATINIKVTVTGKPSTQCKVGRTEEACTIDTASVSAINTDTNKSPSSTTQTLW